LVARTELLKEEGRGMVVNDGKDPEPTMTLCALENVDLERPAE
jgi:hypothetical protein